jgi:IS5 family transposase
MRSFGQHGPGSALAALINLIELHYPRSSKRGGRPPYPLATMLRIHLMQQWYSLSDPGLKEALIEVPTMRRFAGIDMISERIPDETTILAFPHLLDRHHVGERIFETLEAHLKERGMSMKQGTHNVREFVRIEGLDLVDWATAA